MRQFRSYQHSLKFISFSWQFIDSRQFIDNILGNIFWQYSGPYRELRLERQFEDELPALTQATPPLCFPSPQRPGGFSRHSQEESNTVKNVHESWVVFLVFFFTVSPGSPTWEKFPYFPVFFKQASLIICHLGPKNCPKKCQKYCTRYCTLCVHLGSLSQQCGC